MGVIKQEYNLQDSECFQYNNIPMKNYRSTETFRGKQQDKNYKYPSNQHKTFSPVNHNQQNRLVEYQSLAKKAKQQLKQFEGKRKYSPQIIKYQRLVEENSNNRVLPALQPTSTKSTSNQKNLQHTYSYKYFKRDNPMEQVKYSQKEGKLRPSHRQSTRADKLQTQMKVESPKKKHYIDGNEYKKLHQKLDIIQNKITDMKKNLQKKKEEKQKNIQNKQKNQNQGDLSKKIALKGLVTQVPQHSELHTFNTNPYSPRHNIYYVSELLRAYKDQRSLARQHLLTSLNILKMLQKSKRLSQQQIKKIMMNLPRKKGYQDKKTIIFDLDETLIHCNDTTNPPYDVKLPIKFPNGQIIEAGINIRPYSRQILKNLSKYFEVILFTASHSCYANVVIDYLDPNRQWVHHRLYRQHCFLSSQGLYIKDLRIINRDMKDMLLVDNAAYSYAYQLQNGIPIFPYYHGEVDFQLKMLEEYLIKLAFCKDLRESNQKVFRLTEYKHYYNKPEKLVEQLYLNK